MKGLLLFYAMMTSVVSAGITHEGVFEKLGAIPLGNSSLSGERYIIIDHHFTAGWGHTMATWNAM